MFAGVVIGLRMLAAHEAAVQDDVIEGTSAVVLLSDGKPERGLTDLSRFRSLLKLRFNLKKYPIFSLAFGSSADHDFLEKLSLENNAVSRQIFESFDASEQIANFFKEIANPVLSKISMTYIGNVNNLTQTSFEVFHQGTEITVMGTTDISMDNPVEVNVVAFGFGDDFSQNGFGSNLNSAFDYPVAENIDVEFNVFFERMWAYLSIQQLMKRELIETNPAIRKTLRDEVIETALKYNFVTPFTSIIAEKPDNGEELLGLFDGQPANEAKEFEIAGFEIAPPPPRERIDNSAGSPDVAGHKIVIQGGATAGRVPVMAHKILPNKVSFFKPNFVQINRFRPAPPTRRPTTTTTTTPAPTTTTKPATSFTSRLPLVPRNPDEVQGDPGCEFSLKVFATQQVIVESPGYVYRRNMTCKWAVTDFMNRQMEMHFERFDLESNCNRDRVLVYIDDEMSSKAANVFCGSGPSSNRVFSSAGRIILIMQTNNVVQGRGFKAIFK